MSFAIFVFCSTIDFNNTIGIDYVVFHIHVLGNIDTSCAVCDSGDSNVYLRNSYVYARCLKQNEKSVMGMYVAFIPIVATTEIRFHLGPVSI